MEGQRPHTLDVGGLRVGGVHRGCTTIPVQVYPRRYTALVAGQFRIQGQSSRWYTRYAEMTVQAFYRLVLNPPFMPTIPRSSIPPFIRLHTTTMWFSFPHVASLATGLLSSVQDTFNIGRPSVMVNYTRLDSYVPYMEFARTAYCDASIVNGWHCGGLSFL
jgi:hypothetical protein